MRCCLVRSLLITLAVFVPVLDGCSFGGRQQPTRLYVLTALPGAEIAPSNATRTAEIALGIGPVELPEYVNRSQIVTGTNGTELRRAPSAQWAESLEDNFSRVLAENLSMLLATDRVAVFPWKGPMPIQYQVIVEVTRFLGEPGGEASLVALWNIIGEKGRKVLVSRKSSFREPVGTADYEALIAALSRTVAALSRDIAAAITTLAQPTAPL